MGGGGSGWGGGGGCERRIEVFVKIQKKIWGGGGLVGGVGLGGSGWMLRKNLNFCENSKKKLGERVGGSGGRSVGGGGLGGGSGWM